MKVTKISFNSADVSIVIQLIFVLVVSIKKKKPVMLSLVSAHTVAGLTDVCYTKDGKFASSIIYLFLFFY